MLCTYDLYVCLCLCAPRMDITQIKHSHRPPRMPSTYALRVCLYVCRLRMKKKFLARVPQTCSTYALYVCLCSCAPRMDITSIKHNRRPLRMPLTYARRRMPSRMPSRMRLLKTFFSVNYCNIQYIIYNMGYTIYNIQYMINVI